MARLSRFRPGSRSHGTGYTGCACCTHRTARAFNNVVVYTRRKGRAALLAGLLLTACSSASPSDRPFPAASQPETSSPLDPRLGGVVQELGAHPEWVGADAADTISVTRSFPVAGAVCLGLATPGGPPAFAEVVLRNGRPALRSVAIIEEAGPRLTLVREEPPEAAQPEICAFVAFELDAPPPADPDEIEVNGGLIEPGDAVLLQQALFEHPEQFGAPPTGGRSINVHPHPASASGDADCYSGVVFVSGPVSVVAVVISDIEPRAVSEVVIAEHGWEQSSTPC